MSKAADNFARRNPLSLFFVLAYAIAWILWLPLVLSRKGVGWIEADVPFEFIIPGAFAPTIAALLVQWLLERNPRIAHFVSSPRRFVTAVAAGLGLVAIGYIILPALAIAAVPPAVLHWSALFTWSSYHFNCSTFLGGPLNEEAGWRGFALPRLQARFGPLGASLILGPLWAAWHLPLFLLHGWGGLPFWAYGLVITGLTIVLTFGANISGFSIVVCILMHALFNTSSRLLGALMADHPQRTHSLLLYVASSLTVPAAIVLLTRGRLGAASGVRSHVQ